MFQKSGDSFNRLGYPFSREIEDVGDPDAVWVKTVELYVQLLAAPKRRRAFENARLELMREGSRDAVETAADIGQYLAVRR